MRAAMIGLGKLGLPVSCAMVQKGHKVYGYEIDEGKRIQYRDGVSGLYEPSMDAVLRECLHTGLYIEDVLADVIKTAEIIFIAVPTPSEPRGAFDVSLVQDVLSNIGSLMQQECSGYKVVAVISTVLPMTCKNVFLPALRQHIDAPGNEYGFAYNAQFIAMGSVIENMLFPEFVLVGEYDKKSGDVLERFYKQLTDAPILRMSIESAEMTKMAYNCYISQKIVLANTIMEMADKIPYADCDAVSSALSMATDRIVSARYMRGGMGDGGGCLLPDQLVYTEHGPMEIQDIIRGDLVLGQDGKLHEVLKTFSRHYDGSIYRVKARGTLPVYVTEEHPFFVAEDRRKKYLTGGVVKRCALPLDIRTGEIEILPASEISKDYYAVFPKPVDNSKTSPLYVTDEYVKLAGYYLAEGCLEMHRGKPARIGFCFHEDEIEYIDDVETSMRYLYSDVPMQYQMRETSKAVVIRFSSIQFAEKIFNDLGKGAEDKRIPSWILYGDKKWGVLLIRGMWRGDGCAHKNGFSYSTISKHLAYGLSIILRRLDIPHTIKLHPARIGKNDGVFHKPAYDIEVRNAAYIEQLVCVIDMPNRHQMQAKRHPGTIFIQNGFYYHKIQEVEEIYYQGPVHNLQVADTETFVCNAGLIHNCHPRDNIALSYLANQLDLSANPFGFVTEARENQSQRLANIVSATSDIMNLPVAILGLTFKTGTNLTEGSPALLLIDQLNKAGILCREYDPVLHPDPLSYDNPLVSEPHIYVIATYHKLLKGFPFVRGSIIIDPWRLLDIAPEGCFLRSIGRHNNG